MYWYRLTYYQNIVINRVEKYFFDTSPTVQTVDKSTFIEGGKDMKEYTSKPAEQLSLLERAVRVA